MMTAEGWNLIVYFSPHYMEVYQEHSSMELMVGGLMFRQALPETGRK